MSEARTAAPAEVLVEAEGEGKSPPGRFVLGC
jgi:hypothetical protein